MAGSRQKREYPPWRTDGFAINPQRPRYGKGRGAIREAVCDFWPQALFQLRATDLRAASPRPFQARFGAFEYLLRLDLGEPARALNERGATTASAVELRSPTYHALHVRKGSLAGDPIIDTIRFTSTSEGRHSRLDWQPNVNKPFLGPRDRTRCRLMVEQGYRALGRGPPGSNPCLDFGIDLDPCTVDVLRARAGETRVRRERYEYRT
jgi:hypothetical protein